MAEGQWAEWIESNPDKLGGKPRIKGTRISVEFVLELLAGGETQESILRNYPQITRDGLSAALNYAAKAMKNEVVWDLKLTA